MKVAAIILQYSQYKESSLLLSLLTREHGAIKAHFRHAKSAFSKKGFEQLYFRPFSVDLKPYQGLHMVQSLDAEGVKLDIKGRKSICCFYLNELLKQGWQSTEPCEKLFDFYCETLENIATQPDEQTQYFLRQFELQFLKESGYEVVFDFDCSGKKIEELQYYAYKAGVGFELDQRAKQGYDFTGKELMQWSVGNASCAPNKLRYVCRQAISHCLQGYEFQTKKVYQDLYGE